MSELVIHGVPGSPFVRAPLIAALEKGVPWRLVPLGPGESRQPPHLTRHPFGRVPAMEHDGFALYETQAILRYIDQAFAGPALTPADPKAAARMNQVMGIIDWYVFPSLSIGIAFNRVVAPMFGIPVNEEAVAAAIEPGRTCIKALEEILGSKPYFTGDDISLADILAAPHLDFAAMAPEGADLLAGSPLLGWLERMNARPSLQATTMPVLRAEYAPEPA
jgi:glutathione S-transferase